MKFGSLFAGIGGFDKGFHDAGLTCAWQVEIDAAARSVLARHFAAPQFMDVRSVGAHNLQSVGAICGGFPCQDLSIAGRRAGLEGARSGLFYEMVRIVNELRPAFLIWENVPGLLSSDNGRDFARVLHALDGIGYHGAWTVLDAQFFGVAQRRQRVFGVFARRDIGAAVCAEILSLAARLPWNTPKGGAARESVARSLTAGTSASRGVNPPGRRREDDYNIVPVVKAALTTGTGLRYDADTETLVPAIAVSNRGHAGNVFETLRADSHGALPMVAAAPKAAATYDRGDGSDNLVFALQHAQVGRADSAGPQGKGYQPDVAFTQDSRQGADVVAGGFGVRRLTPVECERLQGFPDGWTAGQPDSTRYRQLGNAVAVPVARWIGSRLMESLS